MVVSENQVAAFKVDLFIAGTTTSVATDLEITGGSVIIDRTAAIRRSCTVNIADDDGSLIRLFTGTSRTDPGPMEIVPYRGFVYPSGRQELIPQGVFRVSGIKVSDQGAPTAVITGYDRSRAVSRAKLTTAYPVVAGQRYLDAAANLVDFCLPYDIPIVKSLESVDPTTLPGVLVYNEQDDPWQRVQELVASVGCECFFDQEGAWRARDIPDPFLDEPVFKFVDGLTSTMLSVDHELSDEPGYNGILMIGENSGNDGAIPRVLVVDNNQNSTTYWYGPYGRVPEFVQDSSTNSTTVLTQAGTARLRSRIGRTETMTMAIVPHSALDGSDVIGVVRPASGIDTTAIIEQLTVPLDLSTAATVTCRTRREVIV